MNEDTPTYKKIFAYLRTKVKESIEYNKSTRMMDESKAIKDEVNDVLLENGLDVNGDLIKQKEDNFNREILKNIEINKIMNSGHQSVNLIHFGKGYNGFEDSIEVLDDMCQQNGLKVEDNKAEENSKYKRMKQSNNKFVAFKDKLKNEDNFNFQSGILVSKILENGKIVFKKTSNELNVKLNSFGTENTRHLSLLPVKTQSLMKNKEKSHQHVITEEIKKDNYEKTISITILRKQLEIPTFTFEEYNFSQFRNIKKIAEATYSEVYLIDNLIYKIIPFKLSDEKAFHKEVYLIKELSKYKNTPDFYNAFILKGSFDKILVKKFEEFKKNKESINSHPLTYKCQFGVIIMEDCGKDLESYELQKHEVKSFFHQLINQICLLEKELEFEHRDLHWGNIMIKKEGEEILVKIIDFTLSRIKNDLGVLYMDLKKEKDIFECTLPDEQYTVYPQMKFLNKNNWKIFTPTSNLLWVKYLINKVELKVGEMNILNQMRDECANCVNMKSLKRKLEELKIF